MALTNAYVTVDDLNSWLANQVPVDQFGEAETAINAASRWVDRYCDRHFYSVTATRTFAPCSWYGIDLGCDLVSVTTFKTDDNSDGTFETTWTTSEYETLTSDGGYNTSEFGEAWPYRKVRTISSRNLPVPLVTYGARRNLLQIAGSWGWSAVPDAVKQAVLIQSALLLSRKQSTQGVAGFGDFGVVRVGRDVDPTVRDLLAPYRYAAGVGIA